MKIVELNRENLQTAISIQNTIFPTHDASQNYRDAVEGKTDYKYCLLFVDNVGYVGVSGLYSLKIDSESAWLGWFGILEQYRRNRYGSEALRLFEEQAKGLGFKYCRLYTDRYDNDAAIKFYESNGYAFEQYENRFDPSCFDYPVLIGTKCLYNEPLVLWNDRNIGLTEQTFKQTGFNPRKLTAENLDEVTALYETCFLDNGYFLEQFKGQDLKEMVNGSFRKVFEYCLKSGYSYGVFVKDKLVGISLNFDFYEMKKKCRGQFNSVFTNDCDDFNYPYQHEFHEKAATFCKPILYVLAIAVDKSMRGKGIARILVDNDIISYPNYTVMSDVTSKTLLNIFKKKRFDVSVIDDDYYLVYKEPIR